jgi:hypothetical protein
MPTSRSLKPLAVSTLVAAGLGLVLMVVGQFSQLPASFLGAGYTLAAVGFTGVGMLGRCSAKFNKLNSGAPSAPLDLDILFPSPSESSAPSVGDCRQSTEIVDRGATVQAASPQNTAVDPMSVSNPNVASMQLFTLNWPPHDPPS